MKNENLSRKKKGKREYLKNKLTRELMTKLEAHFKSTIEVPRIRVREKQSVETLIYKEALLFSKYLRNERKTWTTRIEF